MGWRWELSHLGVLNLSLQELSVRLGMRQLSQLLFSLLPGRSALELPDLWNRSLEQGVRSDHCPHCSAEETETREMKGLASSPTVTERQVGPQWKDGGPAQNCTHLFFKDFYF